MIIEFEAGRKPKVCPGFSDDRKALCRSFFSFGVGNCFNFTAQSSGRTRPESAVLGMTQIIRNARLLQSASGCIIDRA